jgi:oxygen-dependent protoporphyrinogen oxidase
VSEVIDVAIVGGGIAGLSAAYELQRRGCSYTLLEAGSRPGGVVRTERFDGWVVDCGPDAILAQKPAGVGLCRELGIADRLITTLAPRTAYVLRDDTLHPLAEGSFLGFPLSLRALALSSLFTPAGKARMAAEVLVPRRAWHEADDESIGAFVRRRFGQEAADYLADPLLAGIHAGDADALSVRTLFPRLVEAERQSGSVLRAFRALKMTRSPQGAFVSLPGGTGELVEALAAALTPGSVRLGVRVTEIHRAGDYTVEWAGGSLRCRTVLLCVPAYAAAGLLRALDTSLAAACDSIPYASTATVALGYRRDQVSHPLQGTGFVVPKAERRALLAGTWVTSKWPGRAPEGHVLLRGFLGGGRDPHRLERHDDDSLVRTATEELSELLGITGEPIFTRLSRWPRQSPQYVVGHQARVAVIEQRLRALPGLFLAGSGFRAIGIPDCIADGRAAASSVAGFLKRSTAA